MIAFAFRSLVDLGFLVVTGAIALGFAGALDPELDLLSHFRLHLTVGALACIAAYAILRDRRRVIVAALVAGVGLAGTLPWLVPTPVFGAIETSSDPVTFRLMSFNVEGASHDPDAIDRAILDADPDVIVMPELWGAGPFTGRMRERYPHLEYCSSARSCSVGLISRYPLANGKVLETGSVWRPGITAEISIGRTTEPDAVRQLTLVGVHSRVPFNLEYQRHDLDAVADIVMDAEGPVIVAGDFNATPWSGAIRRFIVRAGVDRVGGYRATWPSWLGPFGIWIDHAFSRGPVRITDVDVVGAGEASDHRALVMTVTVY